MEHLTDDILNAYLDGEPPAGEELAHLASCETCTTRLTQLREVAVALGAPPPPPDPAVRERQLALAAASAAPKRASLPTWLGAAAAVVIVAGVAAAAISLGGHSTGTTGALKAASPTTTSSSASKAFASAGGSTNTAASGAAAGASPSPAAPQFAASTIDGGDLGPQTDIASVVAVVQTRLESTPSAAGGAGAPDLAAENAPCSGEARADATRQNVQPGALLFHATMEWQGQRAILLTFAASAQPHTPGGPLQLEIMRVAGCLTLASRTT